MITHRAELSRAHGWSPDMGAVEEGAELPREDLQRGSR